MAGGHGDQIILEEDYDEHYDPTDAELREYCSSVLGFNGDSEPELLFIAKEALKAPLPPNWKPCRDQATDEIYYFNFKSGESQWDDPRDEYYREMVEVERKKHVSLRASTNKPNLKAADSSLPAKSKLSSAKHHSLAPLKSEKKKEDKKSIQTKKSLSPLKGVAGKTAESRRADFKQSSGSSDEGRIPQKDSSHIPPKRAIIPEMDFGVAKKLSENVMDIDMLTPVGLSMDKDLDPGASSEFTGRSFNGGESLDYRGIRKHSDTDSNGGLESSRGGKRFLKSGSIDKGDKSLAKPQRIPTSDTLEKSFDLDGPGLFGRLADIGDLNPQARKESQKNLLDFEIELKTSNEREVSALKKRLEKELEDAKFELLEEKDMKLLKYKNEIRQDIESEEAQIRNEKQERLKKLAESLKANQSLEESKLKHEYELKLDMFERTLETDYTSKIRKMEADKAKELDLMEATIKRDIDREKEELKSNQKAKMLDEDLKDMSANLDRELVQEKSKLTAKHERELSLLKHELEAKYESETEALQSVMEKEADARKEEIKEKFEAELREQIIVLERELSSKNNKEIEGRKSSHETSSAEVERLQNENKELKERVRELSSRSLTNELRVLKEAEESSNEISMRSCGIQMSEATPEKPSITTPTTPKNNCSTQTRKSAFVERSKPSPRRESESAESTSSGIQIQTKRPSSAKRRLHKNIDNNQYNNINTSQPTIDPSYERATPLSTPQHVIDRAADQLIQQINDQVFVDRFIDTDQGKSKKKHYPSLTPSSSTGDTSLENSSGESNINALKNKYIGSSKQRHYSPLRVERPKHEHHSPSQVTPKAKDISGRADVKMLVDELLAAIRGTEHDPNITKSARSHKHNFDFSPPDRSKSRSTMDISNAGLIGTDPIDEHLREKWHKYMSNSGSPDTVLIGRAPAYGQPGLHGLTSAHRPITTNVDLGSEAIMDAHRQWLQKFHLSSNYKWAIPVQSPPKPYSFVNDNNNNRANPLKSHISPFKDESPNFPENLNRTNISELSETLKASSSFPISPMKNGNQLIIGNGGTISANRLELDPSTNQIRVGVQEVKL